jgi:hypothetical protein
MFEWQDDRIRRTTGAEDRFFTPDYVESHFNWRIPPEYREEVLSVCRSSGG